MRSRYDDVDVPDQHLTDYVLATRPDPALPAFVDGITGRTVTYGELAAGIDELTAGLLRRGLSPGDVVAVVSPNSVDYPVVFHAVLRAGGVVTPVNPQYTAEEIAHQLRDSAATTVFTVPECLDRVDAAADAVTAMGAAAKGAAADGAGADGAGADGVDVVVIGEAPGRVTLADVRAGGAGAAGPRVEPSTALAALPYSSGTTGLPKGVMLTHRNLVANVAQFRRMVDIRPGEDKLIAVLPFFHIYGLTVLRNVGIQSGITVVTMPRFDLTGFLRVIQDLRITRACVAPPIVLALAKHPSVDDYDLSSLRRLTSGAAPLDAALAAACQERLGPGVAVRQGFGMTELSPVSHVCPDPGRAPAGGGPAPFGSIGYAAPNTECRIVDLETGADVAPGGAGELWVRGPQVMTGYLGHKESGASAPDADGWMHTGDVASVDDAGCYRIVDRVKELIKYKGFQVAPAELEALLLEHPSIADAAVIGVPDPEAGELPRAYVVRRAGTDLDGDDVMAYVADHVAPHKKIRQVAFVDAVPKSATGKILRKQLRAAAVSPDNAAPDNVVPDGGRA